MLENGASSESVDRFRADLHRSFVYHRIPSGCSTSWLRAWLLAEYPDLAVVAIQAVEYYHIHDKIVEGWRNEEVT